MKMKWYYADNMSAEDILVDEFADSKFGIDRWNSFSREIIQNSIDAVDDESKPVEVVFDLNKELSLENIPEGYYIKEVISRCYQEATNKQTKSSYKKGLEILNKDKVYCLKISDYNTKGVKTGRDDAWGALVFDEGKSIKQRPGGGSAGSHGVGKKVPYIISACNTVYYATKNKYKENEDDEIIKSDNLFQGKTVLITWKDDNEKRRYHKGWLGKIDEEEQDYRNKSKPIMNDEIKGINEYFVRKDKYGTDVTIIGVNAYEGEDEIKKHIINAILDNFFVSILENKLSVNVFGVVINKETFKEVYDKYYKYNPDINNSYTPLSDFLRIYDDEYKTVLDIETEEGIIGQAEVFFDLGSEYNRKYYAIIRNHGMKITENRVNKTDQVFSCFVILRGEIINERLSSLENAAHDKFITKDDNMDIDEKAVAAYNKLTSRVRSFLVEKCKLEDVDEQDIEGLQDILSIPGQLASVKNKKHQVKKLKKKIPKQISGAPMPDGEGYGGRKGETKTGGKEGTGKGTTGETGDIHGVLWTEYEVEPVFIKTKNSILLKFKTVADISSADIVINSVNSEDKSDDTIKGLIKEASLNGDDLVIKDGKIRSISLKKDILYSIDIKLKSNLITKMNANIYYKE